MTAVIAATVAPWSSDLDTPVRVMRIARSAIQTMSDAIVAARGAYEVCGFLFGNVTPEEVRVSEARPAENILRSRTGFGILADEFRAAREHSGPTVSLVGVYHSHPAGNTHLSWQDRRNAMSLAYFWLTVGLSSCPESFRPRDCRCYVFTAGRLQRVGIDFG